MLIDLQVFPAAKPIGALVAVFHAPEQRALELMRGILQDRQQIDAIQRIGRIDLRPGNPQYGGAPVHGHAVLRRHGTGGDRGGPLHDVRHADAALGQVHLAAHQRPGVGETFAAVVAGENDHRILGQAQLIQRIQHPPAAFVKLADHLLIDLDRTALLVGDVQVSLRVGLGLAARFPRPMRRGVVQAEQEGLILRLALVQITHSLIGQQVRHVLPGVVRRFAVLNHIVLARAVHVAEVADAAGQGAEVVAIAAFLRGKMRRIAQVPLADQRRVVAKRLQVGRQRRMRGGHPDRIAAPEPARHRLLGRAAEAVLVTARNHAKPRWRADWRVGIAIDEPDAALRHPVQVRRHRHPTTVAAQIGKAEVIGDNKNKVGFQSRSFINPLASPMPRSACGFAHSVVESFQ